jgi:hypothetical protein
MILLTSTSDKISIDIAPALTLDVHASYMDASPSGQVPGRQNEKTTIETSKDIIDPPTSPNQRAVKEIHIRNIHASSSAEVTVKHNSSAVVQLSKVTLLAGERLSYVDGQGFTVFDSDGALKE